MFLKMTKQNFDILQCVVLLLSLYVLYKKSGKKINAPIKTEKPIIFSPTLLVDLNGLHHQMYLLRQQ